jgi:transcriptional regulator
MYIPNEFRETDKKEVFSFLDKNRFGAFLMNGMDGFPMVTHLPFYLCGTIDAFCIEFHLSAANPQAVLVKNGALAKWVVAGPSAYVSAGLYDHANVSTYNYQAIHVSGSLTLLTPEEIRTHLQAVSDHFEKKRANPHDVNALPKEMLENYMKEIVVARLEPFKVDAAFKLSQNRNQGDLQRIIDELDSGSEQEKAIAQKMKSLLK